MLAWWFFLLFTYRRPHYGHTIAYFLLTLDDIGGGGGGQTEVNRTLMVYNLKSRQHGALVYIINNGHEITYLISTLRGQTEAKHT